MHFKNLGVDENCVKMFKGRAQWQALVSTTVNFVINKRQEIFDRMSGYQLLRRNYAPLS
jgi:hypothetical protein